MGCHLFRCIQGQHGFASLKGDIAKLIHFRLFSALGEQAFQIGKGELTVRIKLVGVHVLPHALDELSHLGFRLVSNQIRHANEQFATLNLELHHESQFVVALNVVDDLQEGTLGLVETVENQWVALLHDGEPLPIGIGFRWENRRRADDLG